MMNYDIHIENLGAIEEADITITPLTILAGENGTGKSFVTKFLYSILNVTILDVFSNELNLLHLDINNNISRISDFIGSRGFNISRLEVINNLKENIEQLLNELKHNAKYPLIHVDSKKFESARSSINLFKDTFSDVIKSLEELGKDESNKDFDNLILKYTTKILSNSLDMLLFAIEEPKQYFIKIIEDNIENELKSNFQVSEISMLVKKDSKEAVFNIKNIIEINISKDNSVKAFFHEENLLSNNKINRVMFFESPVYWKLLPIIDNNDNVQRYISNLISNERLTGVPKHFLDLKELLFTDFKDGERPEFIIKCANELESKLQGKFKAANSDLTFENSKGQSISKSLVSFGMTNLGIFQAVLSKNIINKGSFVFIDEPESNLHPEWQAILANVLVELAKNGVYVIVTTHSSDMLKAFEISTQEQKVGDELSTYYFQTDGTLLAMDDKDFSPIEQARKKLLETYENLMIRGYLL